MRANDTEEVKDEKGNSYYISYSNRTIYLPYNYDEETLPEGIKNLIEKGFIIQTEII